MNDYREEFDNLKKWPCQNLLGGSGQHANTKDNENGLCNHKECKPPYDIFLEQQLQAKDKVIETVEI